MLAFSLGPSKRVHHSPILGRGTISHSLLVEESGQQDPTGNYNMHI